MALRGAAVIAALLGSVWSYACTEVFRAESLDLPCEGDADCLDGRFCNPRSARCETFEAPPPFCFSAAEGESCDDGNPCTVDSRCLAGACVSDPYAGAVFHWDFDGDDAENRLADNQRGTLAGAAQFVDDEREGRAVAFPGCDTEALVATPAAGLNHLEFTFAARLFPGRDHGSILSLQSEDFVEAVGLDAEGMCTLHASQRPCPAVPAGRWSHVALRWDGVNLELFLDGARAGGHSGFGAGAPFRGTLIVGQMRRAPEASLSVLDSFGGRVDDVVWFNRAISDEQIADLSGAAPHCANDNPCTRSGCDAQAGCQAVAIAGACDDSDACTVADRCAEGICAGRAFSDNAGSCAGDSKLVCMPQRERRALRLGPEPGYLDIEGFPNDFDVGTLEMWLRVDELKRGGRLAVFRSSDGHGVATLALENATATLNLDVGPTPSCQGSRARDVLTAGRWQHIALVSDAETTRLFIDGEEQASAPVREGLGWRGAVGSLRIGTGTGFPDVNLPITLGGLHLTHSTLYTESFVPPGRLEVGPGTLALWRFEDDDALHEESGGPLNAVLHGEHRRVDDVVLGAVCE